MGLTIRMLNQDKRQIMLEAQKMNPLSNRRGAAQGRTFWFAIALALTFGVSGLLRSVAAQTAAPQAQQSAEEEASRKRALIDDERAAQAPRARGYALADQIEKVKEQSFYKLAEAENKLFKYHLAADSIDSLLTDYQYAFDYQDPDAKTVYAPGVGGGKGVGVNPVFRVRSARTGGVDDQSADDDPCEFKIVVLQALIQNDPPRGIAVATDWLKTGSTQTVRCKGAALTLLARHAGKAATPVILNVARNETDPKLRAKAISVLGATNDESVIDALRDFALNSASTDISEAALYALSEHNSERALGVLGEIATSNRPTPLRRAAIAMVSTRPGEPAVDILLKIYDTDQNLDIRKAAIGGLSRRKSERAGAKLLEIARSSDNIELRKSAINGIVRRSGAPAVDILLGLYDSEKNEEVRDQILSALAGTNDPRVTRKLITIARDPQTPIERRKRAIGWLSRSKDPEVLQFLEDLLKQ
jgi:HEAT repeat protein